MSICKECGSEFEPKNKKGVFCSNKCRQRDYRKGMAKIIKEIRAGKVVSAKIIKQDGNHRAEIKIEIPASDKKPTMMQGESGVDFLIRLNEWKSKQK